MKIVFTDETQNIDGWNFRSIQLHSIDGKIIGDDLDIKHVIKNYHATYNGFKTSEYEAIACVYYDVILIPIDGAWFFQDWFDNDCDFEKDYMLKKLYSLDFEIEFKVI